MKEVFAKGRHGKEGGDLDKLSDQQINNLVEYVLSL